MQGRPAFRPEENIIMSRLILREPGECLYRTRGEREGIKRSSCRRVARWRAYVRMETGSAFECR